MLARARVAEREALWKLQCASHRHPAADGMKTVPPLPGITGCRRRADVAAGATVPVTAQRPDPTRPDLCGRLQDRHPVLHLPADPAGLISLVRAAVALVVIVSADRVPNDDGMMDTTRRRWAASRASHGAVRR